MLIFVEIIFKNLNFDFFYPHEVFTNKLTSNYLGFATRCIALGAMFLIRNLWEDEFY